MSAYAYEYCQNHDIDYFVKYNAQKLHIASNGSNIPNFIDEDANCEIQRKVYDIIGDKRISKDKLSIAELDEKGIIVEVDSVKRILYNEGYEIDEITDSDLLNYASSFIEFADMGFTSYDTINGRLIKIAERKKTKRGDLAYLENFDLPESQNDEDFTFGFDNNYLELPK